jgi:hypothetical protein
MVALREWSLQMSMNWCIDLICALVIAVCSGGQAITQEQTPVPGPPPVDPLPILPSRPEVQTFAVRGVGTKCECDNVVSFAQAREG